MLAALCGFLLMFLLERFFCFHHHETEDEHGRTCGHTHEDRRNVRGRRAVALPRLRLAGRILRPQHPHLDRRLRTRCSGLLRQSPWKKVAPAQRRSSTSQVDSWESPSSSASSSTNPSIQLHRRRPHAPREDASALSMHLVNATLRLGGAAGGGALPRSAPTSPKSASQYTALALAFSAGTFICIAASDLLPELQFHSHDRFGITCRLHPRPGDCVGLRAVRGRPPSPSRSQ